MLLYPTLSYLSTLNHILCIIKTGDVMKPLKEKISITIDSDLLELLRQEAERDDRSLSQYINVALKEHIKRNPHHEQVENINV